MKYKIQDIRIIGCRPNLTAVVFAEADGGKTQSFKGDLLIAASAMQLARQQVEAAIYDYHRWSIKAWVNCVVNSVAVTNDGDARVEFMVGGNSFNALVRSEDLFCKVLDFIGERATLQLYWEPAKLPRLLAVEG